MLNTDRPEFKKHLGVLLAAFDRNLTAEKEEAYWLGLHDIRLSEFVANVAKLCALARKGQSPPKPSELRNVLPASEYQPADPKMDAAFAAAEAFNRRTWDEFLRIDPEMARIELQIAKASRILARDFEGSAQYAETVTHDRNARNARVTLWRNRAGLPA